MILVYIRWKMTNVKKIYIFGRGSKRVVLYRTVREVTVLQPEDSMKQNTVLKL